MPIVPPIFRVSEIIPDIPVQRLVNLVSQSDPPHQQTRDHPRITPHVSLPPDPVMCESQGMESSLLSEEFRERLELVDWQEERENWIEQSRFDESPEYVDREVTFCEMGSW